MDILLRTTLQAVRAGEMGVDEACSRLAGWTLEALPFATIDHHRALRAGFPEVVYCAGKTPVQAAAIARRVWERSGRMLATRAGDEHARAVVAAIPEARHNPVARTVSAGEPAAAEGPPILVVTAGTSDLPVAEETVETVRMLGQPVETLVDVGVAGVHRLLAHEAALARAGVVVVVAGMEGALASVVGGLVRAPIIAVPTSVGYGASFEGLAALLAMLSSCAAGVVVVNIDNGFGAGFAAARINALRDSEPESRAARAAEAGEARNVCA
jgi:NCAIR mutase (PurE)-related protein